MPKPLPMLVDEDYSSLCRWAGAAQPALVGHGSGYRIDLNTGRLQLTALYRGSAPNFEDGVPDEETRISLEISVDGRPVPVPERWSGVIALVQEHASSVHE